MKRIVIGIFILTCIGWFAHPGNCQIYLQADDQITFASPAMDTLGYDQPPDSVTIYTYLNGVELFDQTFTTADPEASIANTNQMIFHDQIQDIDGAGGSGFYCIKAKFTYTQGEGTIRYATAWQTLYVYIGGYSRFMADVSNLDVAISTRSSHSAADVWSAGPTFPTNFADLAIAVTTGRVSVGTSYDKTDYGLADGGITAAKIAASALDGKGDWTTTSDLDSLMAMAARTTAALYVPCDTSFTREYPLGQKPKDSICVYCVSGTLGADTTKVATWVSHIHSKSTSTENVIDSLSFDMK